MAIDHHHLISSMMYQVSYSHTGSMKSICAQEYVQADNTNEAWVMGDCKAIGNEVVVSVQPMFNSLGGKFQTGTY